MDEKKVRFAVRRFTKDAAMKKQYQSAPSTPARRLRELSFYYMWYDGFNAPRLSDAEIKECWDEMIRMQQKMGLMDWSYIYKCTINHSFKEICRIHMDILRLQSVPKGDWEYLVEHLPDFDPFKETAAARLAEMNAQEQ
ncbi:MAG: hypothetical protein LUD51_03250 [Clostridia bacterium]|nr:hypothetical protein [Clostridia bacterium]